MFKKLDELQLANIFVGIKIKKLLSLPTNLAKPYP